MGIASSLFFSANDSEKQTLHRRITPSDEQMAEQRDRWNELAEHLIADLKSDTGCTIRTWLQGSYKYATQIRPPRKGDEFDIDLGIFVCWSGQAHNGPHKPGDLRQALQTSLEGYAASTDAVTGIDRPLKPRCGRVHYNGDFHIDVPVYHLDPDADERTLAAASGWEVSDPKALYLWFKDKFDDTMRARVRRQIRYFKCWAALKWPIDDGRPSSVLLTVLAADAFARLTEDQIGADDSTLLALLRQIEVRIGRGRQIRNPVNPSEDLNRLTEEQWTSFCDEIDAFIEVAASACAADNEIAATDLWSQIFAHFFPMPEVRTAMATDTLAKSQSLVPFNLPDVNVRAVGRKNRNIQFTRKNAIGPIPRDCDITFAVAESWKLPSGMTVDWVVRNEGDEAEYINDLGHRAGTGIRASERSAYRGIHYMDCIFRLNGRIYGVRRIPVEITGARVPLRNPVRRPSWVNLRAQR
jgi:hypothetical protein